MKLASLMRSRVVAVCACSVRLTAVAGGLFLPGSGAVSTARAGAAVASTDDGEALVDQPGGSREDQGHHDHDLGGDHQLRDAVPAHAARYDEIDDDDQPYEGSRTPIVENNAGAAARRSARYQPIPVIAVVTDLGGAVANLRVAVGLYAPNAYPFRNMSQRLRVQRDFDDRAAARALRHRSSRKRRVIMPSIAASYRIPDTLDVGARFSSGFAHLEVDDQRSGARPATSPRTSRHDGLFSARREGQLRPGVRPRRRVPPDDERSSSASTTSPRARSIAKGDTRTPSTART